MPFHTLCVGECLFISQTKGKLTISLSKYSSLGAFTTAGETAYWWTLMFDIFRNIWSLIGTQDCAELLEMKDLFYMHTTSRSAANCDVACWGLEVPVWLSSFRLWAEQLLSSLWRRWELSVDLWPQIKRGCRDGSKTLEVTELHLFMSTNPNTQRKL